METEQYMFGQLLEMGYWSHVFLVGGDCYPLLNAYNMAKKLNETGDLMFIGKNHKNHLWDEWQWKTKPW